MRFAIEKSKDISPGARSRWRLGELREGRCSGELIEYDVETREGKGRPRSGGYLSYYNEDRSR